MLSYYGLDANALTQHTHAHSHSHHAQIKVAKRQQRRKNAVKKIERWKSKWSWIRWDQLDYWFLFEWCFLFALISTLNSRHTHYTENDICMARQRLKVCIGRRLMLPNFARCIIERPRTRCQRPWSVVSYNASVLLSFSRFFPIWNGEKCLR